MERRVSSVPSQITKGRCFLIETSGHRCTKVVLTFAFPLRGILQGCILDSVS